LKILDLLRNDKLTNGIPLEKGFVPDGRQSAAHNYVGVEHFQPLLRTGYFQVERLYYTFFHFLLFFSCFFGSPNVN